MEKQQKITDDIPDLGKNDYLYSRITKNLRITKLIK